MTGARPAHTIAAMAKGVLLDIAGVLTEAGRALPGGPAALARLREAGLPVAFLTNTTRKPKRRVVEDLTRAGYPVAPRAVTTPAAAAVEWLRDKGYAPHLLIHPDLAEDFPASGSDRPVAVVVGDAGEAFTYAALNAAFRHLADGAPFLALAANRVFRNEDGALSLDAGAFVAALEHASGTAPIVLGKPSRSFFDRAVGSLGCDPGEVAMVGDDAEADVAGALRAGIGQAWLVRTGKYRDGDADRVDPAPTGVVADIGEAVDRLLGEAG